MNTELGWLCSFFMYWSFPYCPQLCQLTYKHLNLEFAKKHDQSSVNLTNVFDFTGCPSNYVVFDEIKWFCGFTKYTTNIDNKTTIHVNELILTPFSPFDIKYKILNIMWKPSGNVFLGHVGGWFFHIFPRLLWIVYVCACVCVCGGGGSRGVSRVTLDTF